ncbi:hypothetical protein BC826DRAFT_1034038 [Russula brevipes]|nr:hypothetical protein BC826DRAFT_1034038 [Russula brevipes]
MMLFKPLVSLAMAFAAASSVAASVTPVPRGGNYPPPVAPISESQCDTGSIYCCNSVTSAGVGLSCTGIVSANQCNNSPACCYNVEQHGLINIACTPINIA